MKLTEEQFIEALLKSGWEATHDAQYTYIKMLYGLLAEEKTNEDLTKAIEHFGATFSVFLNIGKRIGLSIELSPVQYAKAIENKINELEGLKSELDNLLAIIHRDGGHHTDEVGIYKSIEEAKHICSAALVK